MTEMTFTQYLDEVMNHLEYMGWPAYIEDYDPKSVAMALNSCCIAAYALGLSPRMGALINFSTSYRVIMRHVAEGKKH